MRASTTSLGWLGMPLLLVALAGCGSSGGDGSTAGDPPPALAIQADANAQAAQTIGTEGGAIQVYAAEGARYTLTVPAQAIDRTEVITATPIRNIDHLPLSGGFVAGVTLKPDGKMFFKPATLVIDLPPGTDTRGLVALAYEGAGQPARLYPFQVGNGRVWLQVTHFTDYIIGRATQADIERLLAVGESVCRTADEKWWNAVNAARAADGSEPTLDDLPLAEIMSDLRQCFNLGVLPRLVQAKSNESVADAAIQVLFSWMRFLQVNLSVEPDTEFKAEEDLALATLEDIHKNAVLSLSEQCKAMTDHALKVAKAERIATWFRRATILSLDHAYFTSTRYFELINFCVGKPLAVKSVSPTDNAQGYPIDTPVSVAFESTTPLNGTTFDSVSFSLAESVSSFIGGTVDTDELAQTAIFHPNSPLAYNTRYTVRLSPSIADMGGNALGTEKVWTFRTEIAPPLVEPGSGALGVATDVEIVATFAQDMDVATIDSGTFLIPGKTGDVSYDAATRKASLKPTGGLSEGRLYPVILRATIRTVAGNHLARDYQWTISTAQPQPPVAQILAPAAGISPAAGSSLSFSGRGGDPDGAIVSYHWDFGDGSSSLQPNANHVYTAPGSYRVVFTVRDDQQLEARQELTIEVLTPPDFWTPVGVGGAITAGTWAGDRFVTVGGRAATSLDGITWRLGDWPGVDAVAYGNGQFVAVGVTSSPRCCSSFIMTSPDGLTWTRAALSVPDFALRAVAWGDGKFVAVGVGTGFNHEDVGIILTSPDGVSWSQQIIPTSLSELDNVTWGGGKFVIRSAQASRTSTDGITWDRNATPDRLEGARIVEGGFSYVRKVTWGDGKFIAVGAVYTDITDLYKVRQGISTSADGVNWTLPTVLPCATQASDCPYRLSGVAWSGTQFVAVDGKHTFTSTDGNTWTLASTTREVHGVVGGPGGIIGFSITERFWSKAAD